MADGATIGRPWKYTLLVAKLIFSFFPSLCEAPLELSYFEI